MKTDNKVLIIKLLELMDEAKTLIVVCEKELDNLGYRRELPCGGIVAEE